MLLIIDEEYIHYIKNSEELINSKKDMNKDIYKVKKTQLFCQNILVLESTKQKLANII